MKKMCTEGLCDFLQQWLSLENLITLWLVLPFVSIDVVYAVSQV
jgi:hypothetical protein